MKKCASVFRVYTVDSTALMADEGDLLRSLWRKFNERNSMKGILGFIAISYERNVLSSPMIYRRWNLFVALVIHG